jgi:hypothetical protein
MPFEVNIEIIIQAKVDLKKFFCICDTAFDF